VPRLARSYSLPAVNVDISPVDLATQAELDAVVAAQAAGYVRKTGDGFCYIDAQPAWSATAGADNSAAVDQAINAAFAQGGGIVVPPAAKDVRISARHVIPNTVDLLGFGSSQTNPTSRFVCTTAVAGISFGLFDSGSSGGVNGGFAIHGNNIATNPMKCGVCVGRSFKNIDITNGADGKHPFVVTTKVLTANVATLTTALAHGYVTGDYITVKGVDGAFTGTDVFDGRHTVTGATSTTLTYAKTNANVASTACAGWVMTAFDTAAALVLDGTQNCTFEEVNSQTNWISVIFDKGAGTNTFIKCEMGAPKYKHVRWQASVTSSPFSAIYYPHFNRFIAGCLFEYAIGDKYIHLFHHTAGEVNGVFTSHAANSAARSDAYCLFETVDPLPGGGTNPSGTFTFENFHNDGGLLKAGTAHIDVRGASSVRLSGHNFFGGGSHVFRVGSGGGSIINTGSLDNSGGNIALVDHIGGIFATQGVLTNPLRRFLQECEVQDPSLGVQWIKVAGDVGVRRMDYGSGMLAFGDGTNFSPDTLLYRRGFNTLGVGDDDCFRTGAGATASRPAATSVPFGSQFYDSQLQKPIWSNGAAWKDAAGTTV